jgi:hypothetical protein
MTGPESVTGLVGPWTYQDGHVTIPDADMRRMFEMLWERDETIRRKDAVIKRLQTETKRLQTEVKQGKQ